uniref:Uncharacterized protein n=1 Tax=Parascaris equorum TaxID=6256 RepID=A0A914RUA9_PAREQ
MKLALVAVEVSHQKTQTLLLTHSHQSRLLAGGNGYRYQYSDTLSQLLTLIKSRRLTPHMAVGWWKWAITVIGGVAEIIVHTF